jgi:hypothetical protein
MGRARWLVPIGMLTLVLTMSSGRAAAELDPGNNDCTGSGVFRSDGRKVDAESIGETVVKIERKDSVDWEGSVAGPPGVYSGSIAVDLPPPWPDLHIDSWGGNSQSTGNKGTKDYDLPSFVPAGVEFQVVGGHTDEVGSCSGHVNLEIRGGAFDSPATAISLGATAVTLGGLLGTLRPLFRRIIR